MLSACSITHEQQYKYTLTLLTLNTHILLVICDDSVILVVTNRNVCL